MISIAAVVVTYNNEQTIKSCLDSLSNAMDGFHSIVTVVDNNSQDKTVEQVSNLKFDQFDFIQNNQNLGFTRAVNQGLADKQADYYLVLNPDVTMGKETIQTLVKCLEKHPKVGATAPQLRFPNGLIQPSCRTFPGKQDVIFEIFGLSRIFKKSKAFNRWKMPGFDHTTNRYVEQPQGAFLLVKKNVIDRVGNWDERFPMFFSDVDYCKRIYDAGWKILFCTDTYATHLKGHSIYRLRKQMIKTSHRSFVDYFKKYDKTLSDMLFTIIIAFLLKLALGVRLLLARK